MLGPGARAREVSATDVGALAIDEEHFHVYLRAEASLEMGALDQDRRLVEVLSEARPRLLRVKEANVYAA
jgi:hypothetical protein